MRNAISTIAAEKLGRFTTFLDYLSAFKNWEKPAFLEGNMFPLQSEKRFLSKRDGLQKGEQREIKV